MTLFGNYFPANLLIGSVAWRRMTKITSLAFFFLGESRRAIQKADFKGSLLNEKLGESLQFALCEKQTEFVLSK